MLQPAAPVCSSGAAAHLNNLDSLLGSLLAPPQGDQAGANLGTILFRRRKVAGRLLRERERRELQLVGCQVLTHQAVQLPLLPTRERGVQLEKGS